MFELALSARYNSVQGGLLLPWCMVLTHTGLDPDLSVLGGGGWGGSNWARGQGGHFGGSRGQSPPTENDFLCLTDAFGGLSFIAFCEFLAVFFSPDNK